MKAKILHAAIGAVVLYVAIRAGAMQSLGLFYAKQ